MMCPASTFWFDIPQHSISELLNYRTKVLKYQTKVLHYHSKVLKERTKEVIKYRSMMQIWATNYYNEIHNATDGFYGRFDSPNIFAVSSLLNYFSII